MRSTLDSTCLSVQVLVERIELVSLSRFRQTYYEETFSVQSIMWTTSTTKSAEVRGSKNVLAKICIMSLWKGGACFVWPVQQQKKNNVKSWLLVHWKSWKSTFIQVKIHMRNVPFGNMISECFPLTSKYRNEVHWIQFGKVQRLCANYNFLPTKTQCRPSSEAQSWLWPFSGHSLARNCSQFFIQFKITQIGLE